MTSVYANPRWIRERPEALLDATTLVVAWLGRATSRTRQPRSEAAAAPVAEIGETGWRLAA